MGTNLDLLEPRAGGHGRVGSGYILYAIRRGGMKNTTNPPPETCNNTRRHVNVPYVPQVYIVGGAANDKIDDDLREGRVLVVVAVYAAPGGRCLAIVVASNFVPVSQNKRSARGTTIRKLVTLADWWAQFGTPRPRRDRGAFYF